MRKATILLMAAMLAIVFRAQAAVTVPDDATVEDDWVCSFVMHSTGGDETVSEAMKVAFSGDDVYFHLPNPIAGNTWVKGTIANGVATFARGQYLGNYGGSVYMVGQDSEGICDVVFTYDAEKHAFTLADQQLVLSASATTIDAWAYYTGMTVVKGGEIAGDQWNISYKMHYNGTSGEQTQSDTEPIEVIINGNEVAFNFPNPLNGAAWIRGTLEGSTATFAKGQQMGTYGGSPFYLAGLDESGLCDVKFNYDSSKQVFTLADMYLLINGSTTVNNPWCYFSVATIAKGTAPVTEEDKLVELPDGLTAQDYAFTAKSIVYAEDMSIDHMDDVAWPVKVAFNGQTQVYVRGLCQEMPMSWVQGTVSTGSWDEKLVTFARGQYLGTYHSYPLYLLGKSYGELGDAVFELSGQNLIHKSMVYINTSKNQEAPLDVYANADIKKLTIQAATPANPVIEQYMDFNADEGYAPLMLTIPTTDVNGNIIAPSRLGYRLYTEKDGVQQLYTFTIDKYKDLPEQEMTIIPYELATGYNFYLGGSLLFLNDNLEQNDRLGVQSVYTVGSDVRESEIVWMSFGKVDGLTSVPHDVRVESETLTDLQGRRVTPSHRGLLIKTQHMADGSVRTVKVVK